MVKQEIYKKFGTTEQEYKRLPKKINPEHDKTLKGTSLYIVCEH